MNVDFTTVESRRTLHRDFWQGRGPSLILIPPNNQTLYDMADYTERFRNPQAMFDSEWQRAQPVCDWPTDGIPTVRPNLGVVFIPAIAGQSFTLNDTAMPWPGHPLDRDQIRHVRDIDITTAPVMRYAAEFYEIFKDRHADRVAAYHPDTQGVFDLAHLLYGDHIFLDMADPDEQPWIDELMSVCLDLYIRVSNHVKTLMGEPADQMTHGHGTSQGVFFPHAGVRQAEDTATLISPAMIERTIVPAVKAAATPFGNGAFVHWCGRNDMLAEVMTDMATVRAIDLGNPELYELDELLTRCAQTNTVLYSRIATQPGEHWRDYVMRVGRAVQRTGARIILRPLVFPDTHDSAADMRNMWHDLTA